MSCLHVPKGVECAVVSNRGLHLGPSAPFGLWFASEPRAITFKLFPIPVQATGGTRVRAAVTDFRVRDCAHQ